MIFKYASLQDQLLWFQHHGVAGNLNEMICAYMITKDGYQAGASPEDYVLKRMVNLGYDQQFFKPTLEDMLDRFFVDKMGTLDPALAQIQFFSDAFGADFN